MRREGLEDTWFASFEDGNVCPEPLTLAQIRERCESGRSTDLLILHTSQANAKKPSWIEFQLEADAPATAPAGIPAAPQRNRGSDNSARPVASSSRRSRRSSRRSRGVLLQFIVLIVVVVAGFAIWYFSTLEENKATITEMSEDEQIAHAVASLERNMLKHTFPEEDPSKEALRTVISATQTSLTIKNSNLDEWPSLKLRFITAKGETYFCEFDEPVAAYATLSISLRKIIAKDGTPLSREEIGTGCSIQIEVPGYHPWSSQI